MFHLYNTHPSNVKVDVTVRVNKVSMILSLQFLFVTCSHHASNINHVLSMGISHLQTANRRLQEGLGLWVGIRVRVRG